MLNRRLFLRGFPFIPLIGSSKGHAASDATSAAARVAGPIRCREFGLIGAADETVAFERLRRFLISEPGHTIIFEPGVTYNSRTPKWLAEVQDVTVIAHGARFRNLEAHRYGYADMAASVLVGSGSFFHDDQGTGQLDPAKANDGWLVRDVARGDYTVFFALRGDSVNFAVGDRVLMDWFCRQASSFPPNPAYWLFSRVVAVKPGMVMLADPAPWPFRAIAPDATHYGVTTGRVRLRNLDRPGYKVAGRIRWHGGGAVRNGAVNPGVAAYDGMFVIAGAMDVEVTDLEGFAGHVPTMVRRYKFVRSQLDDPYSANEIDKIIDQAEYEDCSIFELAQGTGLKRLTLVGGRLSGRSQAIRSRQLIARNVSFQQQGAGTGSAMLIHDAFPADLIDVDYCRFYPDHSQAAAVQPGNAPTFTPDDVTATTIVIHANNDDYQTVIQSIDFKSKVTLLKGITHETFTVEDLHFDWASNLILIGAHNVAAPSGAVSRRLWTSKEYVSGGHNLFLNAPVHFRELRSGNRVYRSRVGDPAGAGDTLRFTMRAGEYYVADVNLLLTRLTVSVEKPYTGRDGTATLSLANQGLGAALPTITLNTKRKGTRRVDPVAAHGMQPGDELSAALTRDGYCEGLVLHLRGDGGIGVFLDGSEEVLPLISVKIEGRFP